MNKYNWKTVKLNSHKHNIKNMWFYDTAKQLGFNFENPINMFEGGPLHGYAYRLKNTCIYIQSIQYNISIRIESNVRLYDKNGQSFKLNYEHKLYRDIKYSNIEEYNNYIEEYILSNDEFKQYIIDLLDDIKNQMNESITNYSNIINNIMKNYNLDNINNHGEK